MKLLLSLTLLALFPLNFLACKTLTEEEFALSESLLKGKQIEWNHRNVCVWPGLYTGYLYLGEAKKSYPFESQLLLHRKAGPMIKSKLIITALQGGYTGHEYSSKYIPFVDIYPETGKVVVKGENNISFSDVSLKGKIFSGKIKVDGVEGEFLTVWNENQTSSTLKPSDDVQNTLASHYRGECLGQPFVVDIETKKISSLSEQNKFLNLPLSAKFYGEGRRGCSGGEGLCEKFGYRGFVNLPTQKIYLSNKNHTRVCNIRGRNGALDCSGCVFVRDKTKQVHVARNFNQDFSPFQSLIDPSELKPKMPSEDVAGNYRGFLLNEISGVSQPLSLAVRKETSKGYSYLTGSSRHYWQNKITNNYTEFRFKPRRYVSSRPVFMFEGDTDGIFYVNGFYKNGLVGSWYSKSSGYLGKVVLKKGVPWADLPLDKASSVIATAYKSESSTLKLRVKPAVSKSSYDFFPNKLYGVSIKNGEKKPDLYYVGGVFDRRSGYVGLLKDTRQVVTGAIDINSVKISETPTAVDLLAKNTTNIYEYGSEDERESVVLKQEVEINEAEIKQASKFEDLLKRLDDKALKSTDNTLF